MTREEAIKLIDTHTVCFYNGIDSPTLQALHMAIEALETQELYLKALERMIEFHKTFTRILDGERKGGEDNNG